jgi:hypothetical protein
MAAMLRPAGEADKDDEGRRAVTFGDALGEGLARRDVSESPP